MSFWAAIVLIVAIVALASVIRERRGARLGHSGDEDGMAAGNPQLEIELKREIEALRERIQVLERIATDDREAKRLSSEIERLRDEE